MKAFFILLVGIVLGAAAVWFYSTKQGKSAVRTTGEQIESTAKSARDVVQEKLRVLDLRPEQVKDDLARTGQVVRRKARDLVDEIGMRAQLGDRHVVHVTELEAEARPVATGRSASSRPARRARSQR